MTRRGVNQDGNSKGIFRRRASSGSSSSRPSSRGSCDSSSSRSSRRGKSLQRRHSTSKDDAPLSQSVPTLSLPPFTAHHPPTITDAPQQEPNMPHPFLLPQRQQQPVLNPTMSGGSTSFDSAYGGLYDSGSFIGQNSFYGNMGSFFGSFGGAMESRPFSQSRAPISLDAQCAPFMNSYYYGEGYTDITATSANTSFGGEYEDGDTLPNRTTSSGRILRRVVSFSDVPPLNEENQRTVANTPKRVGFRRMNRQFSNIENERDASASPVQQPTPEQPQQQSFIAISSNSPMFCGYGLTHPRNPVANAYGVNQSRSPYSMNVANYGAPQPPAPPASSSMGFAQPWYSMYGGTNYTTFSNGRPMMMQPRPMMNGFYY